jgi:AmiR/NasT family two-component response regulator
MDKTSKTNKTIKSDKIYRIAKINVIRKEAGTADVGQAMAELSLVKSTLRQHPDIVTLDKKSKDQIDFLINKAKEKVIKFSPEQLGEHVPKVLMMMLDEAEKNIRSNNSMYAIAAITSFLARLKLTFR